MMMNQLALRFSNLFPVRRPLGRSTMSWTRSPWVGVGAVVHLRLNIVNVSLDLIVVNP